MRAVTGMAGMTGVARMAGMTCMLSIRRHYIGRNSQGQIRHVGCRGNTLDLCNGILKLRRRCLGLRGCEQGADGKRKRLQEIPSRHKRPQN